MDESFFVSYAGADVRWAEWIAWELEQAGYRVVIQAWDFRPGSNFVLEMQKAAAECDRTLIVLSPAFLKSGFTAPEWAAAFATDPTGAKHKLLPVRVATCDPEGLLQSIVYIDLVGLNEAAAREALLSGVKPGRAKPASEPGFPGGVKTLLAFTRLAPPFPGGLPPVWTVPFPRNPSFTGREDELDTLRKRLAERTTAAITQPQAVHGLGGVGKTQLGVEYAWRHQADYDAVLWVVADSPENGAANLAALCRADVLNLPEADAKEQGIQLDAVRRWLREHNRWLLVFDSVDSREAAAAVRNMLAPALSGHVIITSRRTDWPVTISALPVDSLPVEEAADFLCNRAGATGFVPGPRADALALARELGGLPLALEQAAAYILRHRVTFAVYLERLRQNRAQLLKEEAEGATRYPKSVAETWLVSEQQLSLAARAVLRLAAFLAPDDIPRALFADGNKIVLEALPELAAEREEKLPDQSKPLDIEAALVELADHSLITLTPKTFSCHRLVQAVQSDRLADKPRRRWAELVLRLVNDQAPFEAHDVGTWSVWESLRAHAEVVVSHADRLGIPEPTGRLLNQLGVFLDAKALYREAEPLMRRALAMNEQSYGPDHPRVAACLNNLAQLLQVTNRLAEAEPLMQRVILIMERTLGKDHPDVATVLNNQAQLLKATNRPAEAEPLMRRALAIDEKAYGPDHREVATDLSNLATLLQDTDRMAEAGPLMRRALAIDERSYGPDHPDVARDLNNLALLLQETNRLAEAEPLYRRALAIDEKSFGPDHPKVAIRLNNLAALLQATKRLAEAELLMQRGVVIFRKFRESTSHEHPHMQIAVGNYKVLLKAMGLPEKEIRHRVREAAGK
jgi:tetratricopeptide (TPR) repeat protein